MATTVKVFKGGPLEVSGDFSIIGKDGKELEITAPVYLCRCGASANKPFCDGSHHGIDYSG